MTRRELLQRAEALRKPAGEAQVRILMLCTRNICRSPMAETLLRVQLGGLTVRFSSAGTRALIDKPMTQDAQDLAIDYWATAPAHVSLRLPLW